MWKETIKRMPVVGSIARKAYGMLYRKWKLFPGSEDYWIHRYASGGNSGAGSYGRLAEFKAEIINRFVEDNGITSIIEYGCGDGNQLKLAEYPSYVGYDVSPEALELCRGMFQDDTTKVFKLMSEGEGDTAPLILLLDVIYHLLEDDIYFSYMETLFDSSERFVIVYSSDYDEEQRQHERRRRFTKWVEENRPHWKLIRHIPNRFPYRGRDTEGSLSDFYIYEKVGTG